MPDLVLPDLAGCGDTNDETGRPDTQPASRANAPGTKPEPDARAPAIQATIETYPVEVDGNGPTREDVVIDEVVPVMGREDLFFVRHRYFWPQGCASLIRLASGRADCGGEINPMQYMSVAEVRTRVVPALGGLLVEAWTMSGRGYGDFALYRITIGSSGSSARTERIGTAAMMGRSMKTACCCLSSRTSTATAVWTSSSPAGS